MFLVTPHCEIARNDGVRLAADMDRMLEFTEAMRGMLTQYNVCFEEVTVLDRQSRVEQVLAAVRNVWPDLIVEEKDDIECS